MRNEYTATSFSQFGAKICPLAVERNYFAKGLKIEFELEEKDSTCPFLRGRTGKFIN